MPYANFVSQRSAVGDQTGATERVGIRKRGDDADPCRPSVSVTIGPQL